MKAVFARVAALMHVVLVALLAPVQVWYRRTWCFYEGPPSDLKGLKDAFDSAMAEMKKGVDRAEEIAEQARTEAKKYDTITGETNQKLKEIGEALRPLSEGLAEAKERLVAAEQKLNTRGAGEPERQKSPGELFVESAEYKDMLAKKSRDSMPVSVGSVRSFDQKAVISSAPAQNQPLVGTARLPIGIVFAPEQRLTIRDLLTTIRTSSNHIEWVKETLFTNNAGPQYDTSSPTPGEAGAVKPESALTFELVTSSVVTLAHWIPASRQVLSDAPMLRDYIDMRLRYGLKLEEEDQLLNGNGSNGNLSGLKNQDTAYTGGATNSGGTGQSTQAIDTILRALTQVRLSFYEPNGVILHPTNWMEILLLKDTEGRYLFSDPHSMNAPSIWGKPVVATVSQTINEFTVGAFDRAAMLVDREDATVRVSEHHSDFFVRNLVAILCEERLALAVTRPAAIVSGTF